MPSYETRRHKGLLEAKAILAGAVFVQEDQTMGFLQKVFADQLAANLFGIVQSSPGERLAASLYPSLLPAKASASNSAEWTGRGG